MARLAALVPRPRLNLTRFHGVFAPNFKHRAQIVPRRARGRVDADKPLAPMTWPLPHIRVLRGTGTSCPMGAAPQARVRHAPGHPLLMLRINSPCRHRDLSGVWWQAAGDCLHRGSATNPRCEELAWCTRRQTPQGGLVPGTDTCPNCRRCGLFFLSARAGDLPTIHCRIKSLK
jgi:hypothetical protein